MDNNVIAAYSGGALPAAIGIIRMTGHGAVEILSSVFKPKRGKPITYNDKNRMIYGELSAYDGKTIDICLACLFQGPHSYTGEDMAEIYCHGSEAVVAAALKAVFAAGARPAEAGEFTKRAFLNGKMNLSEAEATADLIYSQTEMGAKNAAAQLKGANFKEVEEMRQVALDLISHFYAVCDYADEDIEPFDYENARNILSDIKIRLEKLAESHDRAKFLSEGVPVAIIGRPNVGKSSLFNALLGYDRAIVTSEAGTTRDVIGQRATFGGITFYLMDTAGIREGQSEAEAAGIKLSRQAAEDAELILTVYDGSEPLTDEDRDIMSLCHGRKTVAVINKRDLPQADMSALYDAFEKIIPISADRGEGIEELGGLMAGLCPEISTGEVLITSSRQAAILAQAAEAFGRSSDSAIAGMTADAFLLDAEMGASLLGKILGYNVDIDITDGIFSRFCVGK